MRLLRYLSTNVTVLNILLLAILVVTILFGVMPLFRLTARFSLPQMKAKIVTEEAVPADKAQSASPLDYVMVGENNLFHSERKVPTEKTEEKLLPKPELMLFGTIIGDGTSIAYVEDKKAPKTTQGRGDRHQAAKKGDQFSGFVLREIAPDSITLTRGEETMVVYLTSEGKRKGGGAPAKAAPSASVPAPGAPRQARTVANPGGANPPPAVQPPQAGQVPPQGPAPQGRVLPRGLRPGNESAH